MPTPEEEEEAAILIQVLARGKAARARMAETQAASAAVDDEYDDEGFEDDSDDGEGGYSDDDFEDSVLESSGGESPIRRILDPTADEFEQLEQEVVRDLETEHAVSQLRAKHQAEQCTPKRAPQQRRRRKPRAEPPPPSPDTPPGSTRKLGAAVAGHAERRENQRQERQAMMTTGDLGGADLGGAQAIAANSDFLGPREPSPEPQPAEPGIHVDQSTGLIKLTEPEPKQVGILETRAFYMREKPVEISMQCTNLVKTDIHGAETGSCMSVFAVLWHWSKEANRWQEHGRTEVTRFGSDPQFVRAFCLQYLDHNDPFREEEFDQRIKVEVYQRRSALSDLKNHRKHGSVELSLRELFRTPVQKVTRDLEAGGQLTMRLSLATERAGYVEIDLKGRSLLANAKDCNPFAQVSRYNAKCGEYEVFYRSSKRRSENSPNFAPFKVPLQRACFNSLDTWLRVELFNDEKFGHHEFLGAVETTIQDLQQLPASTGTFVLSQEPASHLPSPADPLPPKASVSGPNLRIKCTVSQSKKPRKGSIEQGSPLKWAGGLEEDLRFMRGLLGDDNVRQSDIKDIVDDGIYFLKERVRNWERVGTPDEDGAEFGGLGFAVDGRRAKTGAGADRKLKVRHATGQAYVIGHHEAVASAKKKRQKEQSSRSPAQQRSQSVMSSAKRTDGRDWAGHFTPDDDGVNTRLESTSMPSINSNQPSPAEKKVRHRRARADLEKVRDNSLPPLMPGPTSATSVKWPARKPTRSRLQVGRHSNGPPAASPSKSGAGSKSVLSRRGYDRNGRDEAAVDSTTDDGSQTAAQRQAARTAQLSRLPKRRAKDGRVAERVRGDKLRAAEAKARRVGKPQLGRLPNAGAAEKRTRRLRDSNKRVAKDTKAGMNLTARFQCAMKESKEVAAVADDLSLPKVHGAPRAEKSHQKARRNRSMEDRLLRLEGQMRM